MISELDARGGNRIRGGFPPPANPDFAPEGNTKFAPAPRALIDGWNIGNKPDTVVEMPAPCEIPARGTVEYTYIVIPTHFQQAAAHRPEPP